MTRSSIGTAVRTVAAEFLEVEDRPAFAVGSDMTREVNRTEIADRGLILRCHLCDLSAKIREMNDVAGLPRLIALQIGGVLKRHPAVAGFGQRAHHSRIEIAGFDLTLIKLVGLGLLISFRKGLPVQVGKLRNIFGIKERPQAIGLNTLHEEIGNPVCEIEVVGSSAPSPVFSRSSRNDSTSACHGSR